MTNGESDIALSAGFDSSRIGGVPLQCVGGTVHVASPSRLPALMPQPVPVALRAGPGLAPSTYSVVAGPPMTSGHKL